MSLIVSDHINISKQSLPSDSYCCDTRKYHTTVLDTTINVTDAVRAAFENKVLIEQSSEGEIGW